MKKVLCFSILLLIGSIMLHSCSEEDPVSFDKTLLYGKWKSGILFEVYNSNGNGHTWDERDELDESEAQPFTWTLTDDNLLQIHKGEMGQTVPRSLTVTELTASTLKYRDAGRTYTFTKVN